MSVKSKPTWLSWLTGKQTWVTIVPDIFYPSDVKDPDALEHYRVLVHERVHLTQQRSRTFFVLSWLPRYVLSRRFRLGQEVEGVAAEALVAPVDEQMGVVVQYARLLSESYRPLPWSRPAARSYMEARDAILGAMRSRKDNLG